MSRRYLWIALSLAALTLTAAIADTCLPVKHSPHTLARWAIWRAAHPKWHAKVAAPVVCAPPIAPAPLPPALQPLPVDDQEQLDLVMEIETTPQPPPGTPIQWIDIDDFGWMIPPDIGVPDESGHRRHHWPRLTHPWRPHKRYTVPDGPTLPMLIAGVTMIGVARWRRA